jgi:hypothetical protein
MKTQKSSQSTARDTVVTSFWNGIGRFPKRAFPRAFPRPYRSKWRPELPITIGCARWPRTIANIPLGHGEMTKMILLLSAQRRRSEKVTVETACSIFEWFCGSGLHGCFEAGSIQWAHIRRKLPIGITRLRRHDDNMFTYFASGGPNKNGFFQRQKSRAAIIDVRFLYIFPLVGWLQEDKRSFPPCNNLLGYSMLQLTSKTR